VIVKPATNSWPHPESKPQRVAILAAADRLLTGAPDRSTGNLSVVQLAIEADIKYWLVAQKHTDLRDHFQQLVAQTRQTASDTRDQFARLQREHQKLKDHCARLEDLVQAYAVVINELSLENGAIRDQAHGGQVTPLSAPRTRLS
jgi:septal ring factor EnvC (AmiA/AmiB activator)